MIALLGPIEAPSRATVLPSPKLSNKVVRGIDLVTRQSQDGKHYRYIRDTEEYQIIYEIYLSRGKMREIINFFNLFSHKKFILLDIDGNSWTVYFGKDQFNTTMSSIKNLETDGKGHYIGEYGDITLELTGFQNA